MDDETDALSPRPEAPFADYDYAPLRPRANVLRGLLAAFGLAAVVAVVFDLAERSLYAQMLAGRAVSHSRLDASDDRQLAIGVVMSILAIASAIAFIAWLWRAYRNLRPLGADGLRFGTGWAIGGWFVPIMNLFRPKQIANDVWRASNPELAGPRAWHGAPFPAVLTLWWFGWIAAGVLSSAGTSLFRGADSPSDYETAATLTAVADSVAVLAAALAVVAVDITTERQAARVAAVRGGGHPDAAAPRWLRGLRQAVVAVLLCGAAAGIGVLATQAGTSTGSPGETDVGAGPLESDQAPAGYSLTDDFSDPESGWVEDEDDRRALGYREGEYHMAVSAGFWSSLLYLGVQADAVELEVDSELRPPTETASSGIGCFVSDLAGYYALVSPGGAYEIGVDPLETEEVALLTIGTAPEEALASPGRPNRIGLRCESGAPDVVTLSLNGREVAEARHQESLGPFRVVVLLVASDSAEATAVFDDLVIRRADG